MVPSLLALCAVFLVGCQSAKQPGSMSHASASIQGRSVPEIQQITTEVFLEAGYALTRSSPWEMVFERPGSRWDAAKWDSWMGEGVTMRVKVRLNQAPDGPLLLQADAYAVQNSENPSFRTESRNLLLSRRPYRKLLAEVARRLK